MAGVQKPMLADTTVSPMWTVTKAGIIRRFAEDITPGDVVVLRVGTQHVYGVGEVVGDYGFSNLFSNVQGWDLQHYRRVRWLWHQDGEPEVFPVYTLTKRRRKKKQGQYHDSATATIQQGRIRPARHGHL